MRHGPNCISVVLLVSTVNFLAGIGLATPAKAVDWPTTVAEQMGVNIHFTDPQPGEMDELSAAGFKWVRMDFSWQDTERQKGVYDFTAYDRLLASLDARKMRALLILDYRNPLYDDGLSPFSDSGRAAFARWAAAAVKHFERRGAIWEMYNEPNGGFWHPKPDPVAYTKLTLAVGKALTDAAPREIFVGPALAGMDYTYLQHCLDGGVLDYFSAVTVHPYRQDIPETVPEDYARLRKMIAAAAPTGKHVALISGEWGYSERFRHQNENNQAKTLAREFLTNFSEGIALSIWYDWRDDGLDPKDPEHHFGIVHHDRERGENEPFAPKPAYFAARTIARTLGGAHFDHRLKTNSNDDWVLEFAGPIGPIIAVWTIGSAHEIALPLAGKFHVTDHLGKTLADRAGKAGRLSIGASDEPIYLTQYITPE